MIEPEVSELLLRNDQIALLDPPARRLALREVALAAGVEDVAATVTKLVDMVDGFGPLSALMDEPGVTDIFVNGPDHVWVERRGHLEEAAIAFDSGDSLGELVGRLTGRAGVRADASQPIADARLSDGSRLHVVLPPCAPEGPLLSIRRFPHERFEMADLVAFGMLDEPTAELLTAAVLARHNIVISGATGTGKTTLLETLVSLVPGNERVVVVEETSELVPRHDHIASLVARGPNVEGRGAVTLDDLARAALRMRPDRIVFGEVRGPEMVTALDAFSTGHDGSLLTVHSRSAAGALVRMTYLSCRGAPWLAANDARAAVEEAFDLVVHLSKSDGKRHVAEILRVAGG